MALLKTVNLPTGVQVTYWKIAMDNVTIQSIKKYSEQQIPYGPYTAMPVQDISLIITEPEPKIDIVVYGYLDELARRAGKEPILATQFSLPCPTTGNFADERRLLLYSELKMVPGWESAIDA